MGSIIMSLIDKINQDFITAYKAKEELNVSVLRMLKSSLKNEEINKKAPLIDEDAIKVLKKEAKQRRDSAAEYHKVGQNTAAENEENELKIIETYLPKQLSEEEIRQIVSEKIEETGAKAMTDMGKVIGPIMAAHGSEVDGATVSKIVKELLS